MTDRALVTLGIILALLAACVLHGCGSDGVFDYTVAIPPHATGVLATPDANYRIVDGKVVDVERQ